MTSLNNGFGANRFPLAEVDSAYSLDPGHETLLRLVETAINSDCGDAWRAIVERLPVTHYTRRDGVFQPVGLAIPFEVTPQEMTQFKASWPILAVYREGEPEFNWLTTEYQTLTQRWSVDYVLGPLTAAHKMTVGKFAISVARCIANVLLHCCHPDYQNGVSQFHGQFAGIQVKTVQGPGVAQSLGEESGAGYYGLTVTVETIERTTYDGYAGADAIDVQSGYVTEGTGTADTLTEIQTDVDIDNETPDSVGDEQPGD